MNAVRDKKVGLLSVFFLCIALCSTPVQAQSQVYWQHIEGSLWQYNHDLIFSIESDVLRYRAWRVKNLNIPDFMEQLEAVFSGFRLLQIQKQSVIWEQSDGQDPCALRLQKLMTTEYFLSFGCIRSQQPVYAPLLAHPDLYLEWAWEDKVSGAMVEHQWYRIQTGRAPQLLVSEWLQQRFPTIAVAMDDDALSFQSQNEQWLMSWTAVGEQQGLYVLRWHEGPPLKRD